MFDWILQNQITRQHCAGKATILLLVEKGLLDEKDMERWKVIFDECYDDKIKEPAK